MIALSTTQPTGGQGRVHTLDTPPSPKPPVDPLDKARAIVREVRLSLDETRRRIAKEQ